MPHILYIIGNGFDLYHGIKSSYKEFQKFIERNYSSSFYVANDYIFNDENEWNDFENSLGKINPNSIYNSEEKECLEFEKEDFCEKDINRFNDTISYNLDVIYEDLREGFHRWVEKIDIPGCIECTEILLPLNLRAKFLTFNYTGTLQKIYNIPECQVLHIHGTIFNPIYGHGSSSKIQYVGPEWSPSDEMLVDIQKFFDETKKDVTSIIAENKLFFLSLCDIDEVHVIGHSLNNIDMPYLKEIKKNAKKNAKWIVTYYDREDKKLHNNKLKKMGLDTNLKQLFIEDYRIIFNTNL